MRFEGIPKADFNLATAEWHFFLLIFLVALVAWIRIYYNKQYANIFKKTFMARYKPSINRDDRLGPDLYTFILNLIFVLSLGFMFYQADQYYQFKKINLQGPLLLMFYCFALLVVYSVKLLVYNFNGFVFDVEVLTREYTDYIYLNLKTLGLLVLPLNILVSYADIAYIDIVFVCFFLFYGIFWLLRIITGMLYGISANISLSYLFLYLCTLEILPVLLLVKLLSTGS